MIVGNALTRGGEPLGPPVGTGNSCNVAGGSVLNSNGFNIDLALSCSFTAPSDQSATDPQDGHADGFPKI